MSPIGATERIVLDYMFGPEVPHDEPFVREALDVAFHVEFAPGPGAEGAAVQCLVGGIVDKGLGRPPMGWTTYRQDGRLVIGVLTPKPTLQERAA